MKSAKILYIVVFITLLLCSCNQDEDPDLEKPVIDMSAITAFPMACDTLYFGEPFTLKAVFTDNLALGSFTLDIHHNFDHHTHSTEVTECTLADQKDPVNPFTLIQDFEIPEGSGIYETNLEVTIPSGTEDGVYDEGDYHFHIKLVDQTGWSDLYGVGVKLVHKK